MNYKRTNLLIFIIFIISTFILLQIIFGFFSLNPFHFDKEKIETVNNILIGLILGFYINAIFYLLNSVLPHLRNQRKSLKICEPYLREIFKRLKISQGYMLHKVGKNIVNNVEEKDFEPFKKLSMDKLTFVYKEKVGEGDIQMPFTAMDEIDFFNIEKTILLNNTNVILSNPYLLNLNEELVFLLSRLKNEMFYIGVKYHVDSGNNYFTYLGLEKFMYEHFTIVNKLKELLESLSKKSELNLSNLYEV